MKISKHNIIQWHCCISCTSSLFCLELPDVLCHTDIEDDIDDLTWSWRPVWNNNQTHLNFIHFQSLLSCVAFGYGCENFAKYEEQGIGIQWSNIAQNPEDGDRYSFIVSILMMLVDALIYWLLTWYIENVFPGNSFMWTPSVMHSSGVKCPLGTDLESPPPILTVSGEKAKLTQDRCLGATSP